MRVVVVLIWFMIKWSSYYLRAWFLRRPSSNSCSRHTGCFSQRGLPHSAQRRLHLRRVCSVCFSTFSFLDPEKPKCDHRSDLKLAFNPFPTCGIGCSRSTTRSVSGVQRMMVLVVPTSLLFEAIMCSRRLRDAFLTAKLTINYISNWIYSKIVFPKG